MNSTFFEYCGIDSEYETSERLIVRRTRPSIVMLLVVLLPLLMFGVILIKRLSDSQAVVAYVVLLAAVAYCIESYRSIQPRTWVFDQGSREVCINGELRYPFERLVWVELDEERVEKGRMVYTRFCLLLGWMAGPERAFASRMGSEVARVAMQITDHVGLSLKHTANGRELQIL